MIQHGKAKLTNSLRLLQSDPSQITVTAIVCSNCVPSRNGEYKVHLQKIQRSIEAASSLIIVV